MEEYLINLLIGIVGGIFSSIIVSRIFLIRQDYQNDLDDLSKIYSRLGAIHAYFETLEIINKTAYDYSPLASSNSSPLSDEDKEILGRIYPRLRTELLLNEISQIRDCTYLFKEKNISCLYHETLEYVQKLKEINDYKFETIDKCKQDLSKLHDKYKHCFSTKSKTLIKLILTDKTMISLFVLFLLIIITTLLTVLL